METLKHERRLRQSYVQVKERECKTIPKIMFVSIGSVLQPLDACYVRLFMLFIDKHGDKKVVITRTLGRINLMGRYVDQPWR